MEYGQLSAVSTVLYNMCTCIMYVLIKTQARTARAGKHSIALPNENFALYRILPQKTKNDEITPQFLKI